MPKWYLYLIPVLLVLGMVVSGSVTAAEQDKTERLIYTSAMGEVTTTPDQVMISVSVETEHPDAKEAQQQNARSMAAILSALSQAGIPQKDLQTTGYSIYPVYEEEGGLIKKKVKLYHVTNTLQIKLRDTARAGEMLDLAVASGANRVNFITFSLSEERMQELRSIALKGAVEKTKADAETVAEAAGLKIVGVKEISTSGATAPIPYYADIRYAEVGASTPVEAGEIKVTAQVSVTYLCA